MRNLLARHFESLLHLKTVVEAGSINRAAKVIGLSQPALTRMIGRLEADAGVSLLTRAARGVYPTEFGRMLLEHVRAADIELAQAETALRIAKTRAGSQLVCGGTFVPMGYLVPLAVKRFSEHKPGSHVRLLEGTTGALLQMLRLGELEVVVCPKMDAGSDDDLTSEPLVSERVGIFADSQNPLSRRTGHKLRRLAETERWVVPDRSGQLHRVLTAEFARLAIELPRRNIESSSMTASRQLIVKSKWIVFSTSLLLAQDLLAGATTEIQGDWRFPTTTISVFHRREKLSQAAAFFVECLQGVAKSWTAM